ncbi:hypothetical protein [Ammoniphilus sp. CFH 90114]|uniref:hypothetical protein n=1 Tax=Ammoniphilus sp. CFH 90114 TaxID=2493665 RepID=UPI00100DC416|nr:hypothetical protein [Ammoniphilus sp. CFH 90114]RXT14880.1 hypothetical protein EIZ39_01320 [Ammoniphilus sp. CFH 90114]
MRKVLNLGLVESYEEFEEVEFYYTTLVYKGFNSYSGSLYIQDKEKFVNTLTVMIREEEDQDMD